MFKRGIHVLSMLQSKMLMRTRILNKKMKSKRLQTRNLKTQNESLSINQRVRTPLARARLAAMRIRNR